MELFGALWQRKKEDTRNPSLSQSNTCIVCHHTATTYRVQHIAAEVLFPSQITWAKIQLISFSLLGQAPFEEKSSSSPSTAPFPIPDCPDRCWQRWLSMSFAVLCLLCMEGQVLHTTLLFSELCTEFLENFLAFRCIVGKHQKEKPFLCRWSSVSITASMPSGAAQSKWQRHPTASGNCSN